MLKVTSSILLRLALSLGVAAVPALYAEETSAPPEGATGSDSSAAPASKQKGGKSDWVKDPSAWKVAIYPVYGWLPIFGAHVQLPVFPNLPGGGLGPDSGNASGSFNGAGFAGFEVQKSGWSTYGEFLYASLSGDQTNPKVHLGLDMMYGQLMGGREIFKGLSLEGGVRRMALKITADVGDYPEVSRKPGVWDPLVGMTWRHQVGKRLALRAHLDGGGFGVGSDVTVGASARADWRFAKHFGLAFGFGALHFAISDTIIDTTNFKKTLSVKQTMYGPLFGFGIYF